MPHATATEVMGHLVQGRDPELLKLVEKRANAKGISLMGALIQLLPERQAEADALIEGDDDFSLCITMGNDAMQTHEDVAAALERVATQLRAGTVAGRIMDGNGQKVGSFEFD